MTGGLFGRADGTVQSAEGFDFVEVSGVNVAHQCGRLAGAKLLRRGHRPRSDITPLGKKGGSEGGWGGNPHARSDARNIRDNVRRVIAGAQSENGSRDSVAQRETIGLGLAVR